MITDKIINVDELLGKIKAEQTSQNSLQLRIETSDEMLEYKVSNIDRDVSLSTRPNGILLSSFDTNQKPFYFALRFSDITSVRVLESFTYDSRYKFSYRLALLFSILFTSITILETKIFSISALLLSIAFGLIMSSIFSKSKRQNILFKYFKDDSEKAIIFSFKRQYKQSILEFISSNLTKTH